MAGKCILNVDIPPGRIQGGAQENRALPSGRAGVSTQGYSSGLMSPCRSSTCSSIPGSEEGAGRTGIYPIYSFNKTLTIRRANREGNIRALTLAAGVVRIGLIPRYVRLRPR